MAFDPAKIPDEQCVQGHLDGDPIYDVLLRVHDTRVSGRLTTEDASGSNHLYFMQGRPVGVQLAEFVHPLGQLLLELGRVNGQTFVRAQRHIGEGGRLAGQVFKELGVLDDASLNEVLLIQARKKVEHFCRLGSRPFMFCRGAGYLTGFTSTPLEAVVVAYIAVRAQLGPDARAAWIEQARDLQVRIINAAGEPHGLPAPLASFGFGAAEERFLQRILGGWEKVGELVENGTLPAEEAAVLLRYLEIIGRLERRQTPAVPAHISALISQPVGVGNLAVPEGFDDVFSSSGHADDDGAPQAPMAATVDSARVDSAMVDSAMVDSAMVDSATADSATADSALPGQPDLVFSGPDEVTDPRRRASIHDQATMPVGEVAVEDPLTLPTRPPFRSIAEPVADAAPPSIIVADDGTAPVVRKKKVKRTEPLPSEGSGVLVSETRREKTQVGPMPTIVIDDE